MSSLPLLAADRPSQDSRAQFNYWVCAIDGGLYGGALCFVNSSTLIPPVVQSLGGPVWLVSLIPVLMLIGFRLPPIFIAHLNERLRNFKPLLLAIGTFQRAPYGIAAGVLWFSEGSPKAAIAAVALAPLASGFVGGLGLTAWQRLLIKCIPENRRASVFGVRFGISCVIGILAGKVVSYTLAAIPGTKGYAILHFWAFFVLMLSLAVFAFTREPHDANPAPEQSLGFRQQIRSLPGLLKDDPQFVRLLLVRFFFCGTYILSPFLAIQCQEQLNQTDSFLGQLIVLQMLGAIGGNAIAGWLGDRFGAKTPVLFGIGLFALMTLWAVVARTAFEWQGIFFLFGFSFFATEVGNNTLGLEMGPIEKRATYLAIGVLIYIPGMLVASAISTLLWQHNHQFGLLALMTLLWLALAMALLLALRERRHTPPTPEPKESPL